MSSLSKSVSTSSSEDDNELRRGPWTAQEDSLLIQYISNHGEGRWNLLAKGAGLRRTGKSCRLRWLNYLKPDVKRGNLTPEEQLLILELHSKWGNRWSKIAHHLPGRTDNEIKNYWRTRIQKQARHLKIDTDSTEFHNIVRRFWMPRLLQKAIESSCSAISLQNQAVPLPPDSDSAVESSVIGRVPSQIPLQGTCMNEKVVRFDHHDQNSDSEYKNSSCMSSSESANIPKIPQFLGSTTINSSQFHASSNSDYGNFAYDGYYGSNNVYDMETSNLATTEAAGDMQMQFPLGGDCQMADNNWLNNDFTCSMWNTDELWQFRNLQN